MSSQCAYPFQELTHRIIGVFFDLHRQLGYGYLESVYRRALATELTYRGIAIRQEVLYPMVHRGVVVGKYRADIVVASTVIVEVKTGRQMDPTAPAQLLNYLKTAKLPLGLVLHFGLKPRVKRVIASRYLHAE